MVTTLYAFVQPKNQHDLKKLKIKIITSYKVNYDVIM